MKIWHLVHQYLPEKIGGTELYTQGVAAMQAQLGHEVTIITPSVEATNPPVVTSVRSNGDREGPNPRIWRFPFGQRPPLQVFLAVWRSHRPFETWFEEALQADRPAVVHIEHLMGVPLSVIDLLIRYDIPYVMTLWDFWGICANAQLLTNTDQSNCDGPDPHFGNCGRCLLARAGLPAPAAAGLVTGRLAAQRNNRIRPVLNHARHLIAPTPFVQKLFSRSGMIVKPDKIKLLPHGVAIPNQVDRTPVSSESKLRVVYIGGLSKQKGLHVLIEAFNRLPSDAHLDLYGDETAFPDYVAAIKALATHPGITFRGRITHDEVWEVFKKGDLAAVPTLWYETFSFVVDEAMAMGTPVLASDIGVMPGKIREGVDGHLIATGDVDEWANILARYYGRPDLIQQLAAGITSPLTMEDHTRALLNLYKED